MQKSDFINTAELANLLRVSRQTAAKIAKTQLKTYKFTDGKNSPIFVKESDVVAWIEKGGANAETPKVASEQQAKISETIAAANFARDSWQAVLKRKRENEKK